VTIRPATAEDFGQIRAIQSGSPEAADWDPSGYDCSVAVVDGKVAGFLVTRETGLGEHEILNLAVDPSQRRRGIARALLFRVLAKGSGTWYLEVRESNSAAINLYKSAGFKPAGRRPNYYGDSGEAAVVMRFYS